MDDPTQAAAKPSSTDGPTADGSFQTRAPAVSLPKGGGAIRGIGEKFAANPVTGTGAVRVPIAASPGRSGFGPRLSISYDSGAGNSPFGFGWSMALPSITRKTDKGLPRYRDADESDGFLLSGAEDLVPVLNDDDSRFVDEATDPLYWIHRYRPRVEGLFARIERWTRRSDGDVHWRSITGDNVLTVYGQDANARIADPAAPQRVFSWLVCETRDDKGNAVLYRYKAEDGVGVELSLAHQQNRGDGADPRRSANRYLKRIHYGNRVSLLDDGLRPRFLSDAQLLAADWMFELVFDYGEHEVDRPLPVEAGPWRTRADPFSSYRAGFEVRTARLCRRVLMFHHFPGEDGVRRDCLVRSTDFSHAEAPQPETATGPVHSFLRAVTQSGYQRDGAGYRQRSLPPVEFDYTQPIVQDKVDVVDPASLENLPIGVDGSAYQWVDLHGEGIPGILTEQASAWFYKRNLSPISSRDVEFSPLERVASQPGLALASGAQFMDLAGNGRPDLVLLDGPAPGFYEHDGDEGWQPFRPFTSRLNRDLRDPNLKFIDLNGDGHADVLISEDDAFVWHSSLAEAGFGPANRVAQALDEETGPRLVFADGTQAIYTADLSGDGLTDLVRIRNGEVCYWPNLGHARFGARVSMDNAPLFDHADQFDQQRIRLADIDGSGTIDILYLHRDGVRLYFNQSGNAWSQARILNVAPQVETLSGIVPTDLRGNGTACLVWSSPHAGDAQRSMRYVSLMGEHKPHLLVGTRNNLGAETRVHYAPSTKFYLQDKAAGKPWITKLPFPVHVVERVDIFDHIGRNRFTTRYAYHHGYFDGKEREFRGFGMVEQWDTEELAALTADGNRPAASNVDAASHVPPVHTRTWFHTGVCIGRDHVSDYFAGLLGQAGTGEYFQEPGLTPTQARALLLPDTVLPPGLTLDEEHEACRALKGSMLRQEVYALDGTAKAGLPYTVSEQNFSIRHLQARAGNQHAVFLAHPREALTYHYERIADDPRIQHALTLQVDDFSNVLKSVAIAYGRRPAHVVLPAPADRAKQTLTLITCTENSVTNAIDQVDTHPHDYRAPAPSQTRTFELTGFAPENGADRFSFDEWDRENFALLASTAEIAYEQTADPAVHQKRLIEQLRTLYRSDDLSRLLPLGELEPLALAGESYQLAFTPGLLTQVFRRDGEALLPDPAAVLGGPGPDRGGYRLSQNLRAEGVFPATDPDKHWWVPSGRVFLSPNSEDSAAQELAYARGHYFLPHRYQDPFHSDALSTESFVSYDRHVLLMLETRDALGNRLTVGERLDTGGRNPAVSGNDYRVLQPRRVMDPNRNRSEVEFDTLGMVVGTAVMGKPEQNLGDSLQGFSAELADAVLLDHLANPLADPHAILGRATSRLVYDLFAYQRTQDQPDPQPTVVYTLARETHESDLDPGDRTRVQHSFSYADGFGREIQRKLQAESERINGIAGPPRWVGSGWTIFNNKGKPVRQYEPFFSTTQRFEFGVQVGVSAVLFYDPAERVVATLHPNHSFDKLVFDAWQQATWDVNDTVLLDPRTDPDIQGITAAYFESLQDAEPWLTWHAQRQGGDLGVQEQIAAAKAAAHAGTPGIAHADTLGRPFLTIAHNRVTSTDHDLDGSEDQLNTRVELDIEGNQRAVSDAMESEQRDEQGNPVLDLLGRVVMQGRVVMRYAYDMLGNRIHQSSMEAGARWMLGDVAGNPIRAWDNRGHALRHRYDPLRRPLQAFVSGADPDDPARELLTDRWLYGEQHPQASMRNLRGALYLQLDQAGVLSTEAQDFKGNALSGTRRLAGDYKQAVDWASVDAALPAEATSSIDPAALEAALLPLLEADTYTSSSSFDALNRPVTMTTPHTPAMLPNVFRPGYNEANLLERMDISLRGANGEPVWTPFVANIDYDAKGQRQRIDYGNGVSSFYQYDPLTLRLVHLLSRRNAVLFPGDCPANSPTGCQLQNLHYHYDPVGNITHIRDDAQQTIYFSGARVEPSADYTYDALYRLINATGREHLGQGGLPIPHSHNDGGRTGLKNGNLPGQFGPNDSAAMGNYTERYVYDAVGNFLAMQHRGRNPAHPGWTRSYRYTEPSQLEPGKTSNRLSSTTVGGANPLVEAYSTDGDGYDAHGSMQRMPHLSLMRWDHRDQLQATARQVDNNGAGVETTWYVYDASGERVRKVTELADGRIKQQRIYLGGFEIYREHQADGSVKLQRETLHVMDDQQRIALVETRTSGVEPGVGAQLIRYQLGNHLGSASLELDHEAKIISYEEYTPYGSTSYQAGRSLAEVKRKQYRYTGMERDEQNGFSYHSARYYLPWLGRWASADPVGIRDGLCLFQYAHQSPIMERDPGGRQSNKPTAEVGDIALHKSQGKAGRKGGARTTESEHVIPKAKQVALTRNPATGQSDYGNAQYRNNTTVVVERSTALNKTHGNRGGPTADNVGSARLKAKAIAGEAINYRQEVFMESLNNAKRAALAMESAVSGLIINEVALAQDGELFGMQRLNESGEKARALGLGPDVDAPIPAEPASPRKTNTKVRTKGSAKIKTGGITLGYAGAVGLGGDILKNLHEEDYKSAAATGGIAAGSTVLLTKIPALAPLAVMLGTISAYDGDVQMNAESAGESVDSFLGADEPTVVGGLVAAGAATGESIHKGVFKPIGTGIGEGSAVVVIRLTSDKYTRNPFKSQLWGDFKRLF